MSTQLPLEMVETIVDHCHDNTKLLGSCSLVCKAWLAPSRFHLFSNSRSSRVSHHNVDRFIELFQSPNSTFPTFFHNLWLRDNVTEPDVKQIVAVVQSIPGSEIRNLSLTGYDHLDLPSLCSPFSQITELSIKLRDSFAQEMAFICSFPQLEALNLSGGAPNRDIPFNPSLVIPARLNTLRIRVSRGLKNILAYFQVHSTLSNLYVYNVDTSDVELFQQYLQSSCIALRHLTFEFGGYTYPGLDFACLSQLRSLTLTTPYNGPLYWSGTTLQTLFTASLSAITLVIHTYSKDRLTNEPWAGFDQLLASERFPSLRILTVMTGTRHGKDVANGLPLCKSKGILLVKTWGSGN